MAFGAFNPGEVASPVQRGSAAAAAAAVSIVGIVIMVIPHPLLLSCSSVFSDTQEKKMSSEIHNYVLDIMWYAWSNVGKRQ